MATPFKGLERWQRLQQSPFGSRAGAKTDPVSGTVGQQYRRKQEDYNTAMRVIRRQARRGDADAALGAIGLREKALEAGIAPGGIRRKEEFDEGIRGYSSSLEQAAKDRERKMQLDRTLVDEEMDTTEARRGESVLPRLAYQRPSDTFVSKRRSSAAPDSPRLAYAPSTRTPWFERRRL